MKLDVTINESCNESWLTCISPDTWILTIGTLIGSALGAFIAGMIASKITKKELRIDWDKGSLELLENFYLIFTNLGDYLKSINKELEETLEDFEREDYEFFKLKERYTRLVKYINGYISLWHEYRIQFRIPSNLYLRLDTLMFVLTGLKETDIRYDDNGKIDESCKEKIQWLHNIFKKYYEELLLKDKEALNEINEIKGKIK